MDGLATWARKKSGAIAYGVYGGVLVTRIKKIEGKFFVKSGVATATKRGRYLVVCRWARASFERTKKRTLDKLSIKLRKSQFPIPSLKLACFC